MCLQFTKGTKYNNKNVEPLFYLLNMLKMKCDINQQYLNTDDLHLVKSE